jgi:DEAD/DEAH box helicase domain-containing protein
MIAVLPRFLGVGDADIGAESCNVDHCVTSRLLLFDRHGAFGLCERIASMFGDVVAAAIQCVEACRCELGCPGCFHLGACPTYNQSCDKAGGIDLLHALARQQHGRCG